MYFKVPVSLFSMSCQTCHLKCHEVMKKIRATMLAKKEEEIGKKQFKTMCVMSV